MSENKGIFEQIEDRERFVEITKPLLECIKEIEKDHKKQINSLQSEIAEVKAVAKQAVELLEKEANKVNLKSFTNGKYFYRCCNSWEKQGHSHDCKLNNFLNSEQVKKLEE